MGPFSPIRPPGISDSRQGQQRSAGTHHTGKSQKQLAAMHTTASPHTHGATSHF